ncbi:hypothetical protein RHGRI_011173 [Rhododendron griersonianum]|uniref:Uncharacterized protein n=1 Tax=Rhododendron griersonianum TaxID=479676 RepID=A0AAV6KLN5_9ERIC|nr:hypothetical protein RHGRI_011173 [Rhododendron griersonianum]
MSRRGRGGQPPFNPQALTQYRSLLAPEYPGPTLPSIDDMELLKLQSLGRHPHPLQSPRTSRLLQSLHHMCRITSSHLTTLCLTWN